MDYDIALKAANLAFILLLLAPQYYLLRTLYAWLIARGIGERRTKIMRNIVMYARVSHPYIALLIPLSVFYHGYVMWVTHTLELKVIAGISTVLVLAVMVITGLMLKFGIRAAGNWMRRVHRWGAFILVSLAVTHLIL